VWWDSNDGCSGLLDSLCDLCVQKYGEFSSRKLVENIRYIGKHGTNEHKMLIWMVSFAHDTQMQQCVMQTTPSPRAFCSVLIFVFWCRFVCGLDASGSRMQPAPVERYQGPDGAFKCAECPVAVHNYLHWLYREILYWFWSGHEDTRRLFASIRSFWVHGMSQSFQAPVVVQTLENH
jgi:hypothetical protein